MAPGVYTTIGVTCNIGDTYTEMTDKRLPIQAAKDIAKKYGQDQVILITWDKENHLIHTVSYGKTASDCSQAALGANIVKAAIGYPEKDCHAVPYRARKKLPLVDYRVEFEGGVPMTCVRIPPGQSYGTRVYGGVTVVVLQAHNLQEALQTALAGVQTSP